MYMHNFLYKIKNHRVLLLSLIFFLSSSFTIRLIASPFTAPATLDPTCAPSSADCYVVTSTFSTGLTSTSGVVTSNLSTGVSGGQSVVGGTASGNNLTLSSTSNATKGKIVFGTSAYDEVNNYLGIKNLSPAYALSVGSNTDTSVYAGTGTGADMHITGAYTGTANATYTITVDGGNDTFVSPNTIEIKKNGIVFPAYASGWGMDQQPTASPLSLGDGLSIGFDEGSSYYSDHNVGDIWTITATATGDISVVGTYRIGTNFFGSQNADDTNLYLGKSTSFGVSTGTGNTHIGISAGTATTTGYQNTLVGASAGTNILGGYANTLIGNGSGSSLTSGSSNTFLGNNSGSSIVSGTNNLFLGINSTGASTTTNSVALGGGATVTLNNSIAIGASATTTLANQMVIGSSASAIDNVFIGNGVTATTAGSVVFNASGGNGSNKAGGNITIAGGRATGTTGVGGAVIFSTSDLGAGLATTAQTLTEKMRIDSTGKVGIGTNAPTSLFSVGSSSKFQVDTNGDIIKLNNVTTTFPASNTAGVLTNNGSGTMSWGSAITGVGTIDSVTKSANGAVISGANLIMQNAGATYPGLVSTGTQTFAGAKTFSSTVSASTYNLADNFFAVQSSTNTVIGYRDTFLGIGGSGDNLFVGYHTGINFPTTIIAGYNSFVGSWAGEAETSSHNTYVGSRAGIQANSTSGRNTFLGALTGASVIAGSYNTLIGEGTNVTTDINNAIAIGYGSAAGADSIALGILAIATANKFVVGSASFPINEMDIIGASSQSCTFRPDTGSPTCTSDERLKINIMDLNSNILDTLTKVRAVTYNWKEGPDITTSHIGFLAQDLQQYFPELVAVGPGDYLQVNYAGMTPILVESIRELDLKVNSISGLTSSSGSASVVEQLVGAIVNLKELIAQKLTTKELCLEDVCITKTELQQLLQQNNISAPVSSVPTQTPDPAPEPVAGVLAPVVDTTQDEVVAPVSTDTIVEQIPDPVIIIEPTPDSAPTPVPEVTTESALDALPEPVL